MQTSFPSTGGKLPLWGESGTAFLNEKNSAIVTQFHLVLDIMISLFCFIVQVHGHEYDCNFIRCLFLDFDVEDFLEFMFGEFEFSLFGEFLLHLIHKV